MATKPPSLIGSKAIEAAVKSGNINIAGNVQLEVLELSSESREAQIQHAEALRKYEAQRRARSIAVPTAIEDVKAKLREMGHPVTLFGENHADRRERLREVIAALELSAEELAKVQVLNPFIIYLFTLLYLL
jgi:pre-mRNA processing factor 4 (PRP4) like